MIIKNLKGLIIISLIALLAACGGKEEGAAPAGGGEAAAPAKEEKKENPITAGKTGIYELEGEVGRSNTILNTFILQTKEGDVEVQVRAMSKMLVNGERVALSQIKSGAYAKGTFRKFNGQDAVKEITITYP